MMNNINTDNKNIPPKDCFSCPYWSETGCSLTACCFTISYTIEDKPIVEYLSLKYLIQTILDDLHGHRGLYDLELINYIVSLEDKYEKMMKDV